MTWTGPERREDMLTAIDRRLSMHEVVCAERYKGIEAAAQAAAKGLENMKGLVIKIGATMICGMATIIGVLVWKVLGL